MPPADASFGGEPIAREDDKPPETESEPALRPDALGGPGRSLDDPPRAAGAGAEGADEPRSVWDVPGATVEDLAGGVGAEAELIGEARRRRRRRRRLEDADHRTRRRQRRRARKDRLRNARRKRG